FPRWEHDMRVLAKIENVVTKIGGFFRVTPPRETPFTSQELAAAWRPYVETGVELFGAARCMFETDYPASAGVATYPAIWNAFRRLVGNASPSERKDLMGGTAARIYHIP